MVTSLSAKIFFAVIFFMMVMTRLAHAQYDNPDATEDESLDDEPLDDQENDKYQGPSCPAELSEFYKECKGTLKSCVNCIQDAEKNCDHAQIDLQVDGSCWDCTTLFAERCDPAEHMCFGYQECGGGQNHCINFKCVHTGY